MGTWFYFDSHGESVLGQKREAQEGGKTVPVDMGLRARFRKLRTLQNHGRGRMEALGEDHH